MKSLKTITFFVIASAISTSALAVQKVYTPKDGSVETAVCVAVAQGGYELAKVVAKENKVNFNKFKRTILCNSKSVAMFSRITAELSISQES